MATYTDQASIVYTETFDLPVDATLALPASSLPAGTASVNYSQTIQATGGAGFNASSIVISSLVTGNTGLSVVGNSTAGSVAITGTGGALSAGTCTFTVTVTDVAGYTVSQNYSITMNAALVISPTSLPAGIDGKVYSQTISVSNGTRINGLYSKFEVIGYSSSGGIPESQIVLNPTVRARHRDDRFHADHFGPDNI